MKNNLFKSLFLFSLIGMAITACNNTPAKEELKYSEAWSTDAVEHWHECLSEGHEGEKGDLAEHTFNEGVVTPATYEADGYTTYTCTVCGYSYNSNFVHKLSHTYAVEWSVDETAGTHYHACLDAGFENLRSDEAEHDYDLGVTTAPTYEAAGYTTYTCKICGHKDIHTGDAKLEHHYSDEWSTSATKHWHACTDEGYSNLKADEADHDFNITVIPATHETPEYEVHECKVCHYIETTEGGQAVEHNFATEWSHNTTQHWHACTDEGYSNLKKDTANHTFEEIVTNPTFEAQGYTTHRCTICGYSYVDSYTNVLPHNYSAEWSHNASQHWHACTDEGYTDLKADEAAHVWNAGVVTTDPTETTTGIKTYTCTVCGETKTEVLPKTSHTYSDQWSNNSTQHWHACTDDGCDAKTDVENHTWDAGEYHAATYALDAFTLYTCTKCGYSYSESVANSRLAIEDEANLTFTAREDGSGFVVTGFKSGLFESNYDVYIPEEHTEGNVTLPVVEIGEKAFLNSDINKLVMGDNLEKISTSAFNNCSFLHTVELGRDVKTIQANSFANCYRMTEIFNQSNLNIKVGSTSYGGIARNAVAVPTTVEERGVLAQNETALNQYLYTRGDVTVLAYYTNPGDTKQNVQLNVDAIKPYAFRNVSHVESIVIPAKLTSIGHHAFINSGLKSVTIPETVTEIGEYAFENCDALENATVANDVISNYEFTNCDALTTVTAASIASVGMGAFEFSRLEEFAIGNQVTEIGASAFASSYLEEINIPANVEEIGEGAFYNCQSLDTLTVAGENPNYSATNNILYSKDGKTLICYPAGLAPASFMVPSNVTKIENNAFFGSYVAAVVLPSTISSIGVTPFRGCGNLQSFLMLDGTTPKTDFVGSKYSVSQGVLYTADYSTLIAYPAQLPTKLYYSTQLNTRVIADYAFEGAEGLEFIFLGDPDNGACYISSIGTGAFRNCVHLNAVSLIANVGGTRFGLNCFEGCGVRTLNFIGTNATNFKFLMSDFNNLHTCGIDTIICMDVSTWYTTSLNWNDVSDEYDVGQSGDYVFAEGITSIEQMSFAASGVRHVVIPKEVTSIGDMAFGNCYNLTSVTFEEGSQLKSIGKQAFGNCTALKSIEIPASVTSIGTAPFAGCKKLQTISVAAGNENFCTEGGVLYDIGKTRLIAYPSAKADAAFTAPTTLTSVDETAATSVTSLQQLTFTNTSALTIGKQAFALSGLQFVAFEGSGSVAIGDQAFAGCTTLAYVVLPSNFTLFIAPFYGCVVLSNLSAGEMSAAGVPFTMPVFYLGDLAGFQAAYAASAEDNQWAGVLLKDDEANPFERLVILRGISFYLDHEPDATEKGTLDAAAAAFGNMIELSYWHYDGTTGMPTLWP